MYDLIEIMTTYQHESESDLSPARFITISALSLKSTGADEKGVEKGREEKKRASGRESGRARFSMENLRSMNLVHKSFRFINTHVQLIYYKYIHAHTYIHTSIWMYFENLTAIYICKNPR